MVDKTCPTQQTAMLTSYTG